MPVFPVAGTVAVTKMSLFTVKVVAFTPPNVTADACDSSVPEIITEVPGGPAAGVNDVITGVTLNVFVLVSVLVPVVTVTVPVCAPAGTVARMNVVPVSVFVVAVVPPNFTTDDELKPWPRIPICDPSLPAGIGETSEINGAAPMFSEKNVPAVGKGLPPTLFVPKTVPLVCCISGAKGCDPVAFWFVKRNDEKTPAEVSS